MALAEKQFDKCKEFLTEWEVYTSELSELTARLSALREIAWAQFRENQATCPHLKWKDSGGGAFGYKTCEGCGMDDL